MAPKRQRTPLDIVGFIFHYWIGFLISAYGYRRNVHGYYRFITALDAYYYACNMSKFTTTFLYIRTVRPK